jgi:hypothetical protein
MGTRGFVQFPLYECTGWSGVDFIAPAWGDKVGDVYVYVGYDGDTLPLALQETILEYIVPLPNQVPMSPKQRLRQLDGEVIAANLVARLAIEDRMAGVRVTSVQPERGFHLLVDFKEGTVMYVGREEGPINLRQWTLRKSGVVFTYDVEDVDDTEEVED